MPSEEQLIQNIKSGRGLEPIKIDSSGNDSGIITDCFMPFKSIFKSKTRKKPTAIK